MKKKEEHLSLHRRLGLRFIQVMLIVMSLLLVMRCTEIYRLNKIVDKQTEIEYFDKGYTSGMNKSKGLSEDPEPFFKNYALKKAYREGYREGWDAGRETRTQP